MEKKKDKILTRHAFCQKYDYKKLLCTLALCQKRFLICFGVTMEISCKKAGNISVVLKFNKQKDVDKIHGMTVLVKHTLGQ